MRVSDWRGSGRPTATLIDFDGNRGVGLIGPSIHGGVPQNSRRFSRTEASRNAGRKRREICSAGRRTASGPARGVRGSTHLAAPAGKGVRALTGTAPHLDTDPLGWCGRDLDFRPVPRGGTLCSARSHDEGIDGNAVKSEADAARPPPAAFTHLRRRIGVRIERKPGGRGTRPRWSRRPAFFQSKSMARSMPRSAVCSMV